MKLLNPLNTSSLYVEIRQRSLRVLHGTENLVIPITRQGNGRLSSASKDAAIVALQTLLKKKNWQPRSRAFCGIEARGVSLRRLSLPASANGDLQRVLRLQIENEFPLPPESLAWGYSRIAPGAKKGPQAGDRAQHEMSAPHPNGSNDFMVVALKKEVLEEYAQMFAAAGLTPVFTLAALARSRICPQASASYAVLDIGRSQSELISLKEGIAESLRVLPWGGDAITRAIEKKLGITSDEAEQLKLLSGQASLPNGEVGQKLHDAIGEALKSLASILASNWDGEKLYLTGRASFFPDMPARLAELLPQQAKCERVESNVSGPTAAILGLKQSTAGDNVLPLVLRQSESKGGELRPGSSQGAFHWWALAKSEAREILGQPALRKWARLAMLLCICLAVFPYAQAFLLKPFLAKKLVRIRAEKGRLATIDRELTFLQYLKNTQPPYLDALTVLANAAPPGTRLDSLSLSRRGELALKGNMGNAQQVVDFRAKLIKSAFFSAVTVEEETPSPDRQRMTVRILAQCKPAGARPPVKVEPLPAGFVPGGSGMPFPGMGPGGPVASFPVGGMPGPMPVMPGGPEGAIRPRGPDGAPISRPAGMRSMPSGIRFGGGENSQTNSAQDGTKPAQ
jgi:type IV pilus assembly protein PilM